MPSSGDAQTARPWEEERSLYVVSLFESLQSLWFWLPVICHVYNRWLSKNVKCLAFGLKWSSCLYTTKLTLPVYIAALASVIFFIGTCNFSLLNEVVHQSDISTPVFLELKEEDINKQVADIVVASVWFSSLDMISQKSEDGKRRWCFLTKVKQYTKYVPLSNDTLSKLQEVRRMIVGLKKRSCYSSLD